MGAGRDGPDVPFILSKIVPRLGTETPPPPPPPPPRPTLSLTCYFHYYPLLLYLYDSQFPGKLYPDIDENCVMSIPHLRLNCPKIIHMSATHTHMAYIGEYYCYWGQDNRSLYHCV